MRRLPGILLVILATTSVLPSCQRAAGPSPASLDLPTNEELAVTYPPGEKPNPPLQLAVPPAPPAELDGKDLRSMNAQQLRQLASQARTKGDYARAAVAEYWIVEKTKAGKHFLACYLARAGDKDAAFYWLQLAAQDEAVDARHAQIDSDFDLLRRDPRWRQVRDYLLAYNRYFESVSVPFTSVTLPKGYQKGTPIPVVLWLHGLSDSPDTFANPIGQHWADELNVAIVGVSGTLQRAPRKYAWVEDPERDVKRLRDALTEVGDRLTVKPGCVITFGFSQGAQVGVAIAARFPEEFAGSIVSSPGGVTPPDLKEIQPSPLLAKRGFVLVCSAGESTFCVKLAANDAAWLQAAKAQVIHKPYPGATAHALPPDYVERFPEWVKFILAARGE